MIPGLLKGEEAGGGGGQGDRRSKALKMKEGATSQGTLGTSRNQKPQGDRISPGSLDFSLVNCVGL